MKNSNLNFKNLAQRLRDPIKLSLVSLSLFILPCLLYSTETPKSDVENAVEKIKSKLPLIRTAPQELSMPPLWPCPHTLQKVEELLSSPVNAPLILDSWNQTILESRSPLESFRLAEEIFSQKLSKQTMKNPAKKSLALFNSIPDRRLKKSLKNIFRAFQQAKRVLHESYSELSKEERNNILILYQYPTNGTDRTIQTNRFKIETYRALKKFKLEALLQANSIIFKCLEEENANLQAWANEIQQTKKKFKRMELKTEIGKIIVSDDGNDFYSEKDLKDLSLLIDAGGKNRYQTPVAGAKEGEIQIAMDWGDDVVMISSQNSGGAGSGVFGIGALFLPNERGKKTIFTGSYSQGFGLCGTGGIFINGKGDFKSERYSQGVGVFGIGVLSNTNGEYSSYQTNLYGQGVGLTQGIGIFKHIGSHATFKAGLVDPDPREPLGMTSLCQGVGYGPRAFAGGGIGFCILAGDQLSLESSYFAQGAGYWRSAGSFYIEGNYNLVKARRYDQGSGIHSALGFFTMKGDHNHLINWGVGPAFGWDGGIGWSLMFGDKNLVQAEWGTGTASINNSRSFSVFIGDENKLNLPGLGSAQNTRDLPDYSISWIEGRKNILKIPGLKSDQEASGTVYRTPWGIVHLSSVTFSSLIDFPKIEWPALPQENPLEKLNLTREITIASALPPQEKIEKWIQAAAAFTREKTETKKALGLLLSLKESERPFIIHSLTPENLEEFIQIRIVIAILGENISRELIHEIKEEKNNNRKVWLISLLSLLKSDEVFPILKETINDFDWRIQTVGVRSAGQLLNKDKVAPGRLYILREIQNWLDSKFFWKIQTKKISNSLAGISFADSLAILSIVRNWTEEDRKMIVELAPEDISGNMNAKSVEKILTLLRKDRKGALRNIQREIKFSESMVQETRERIHSFLRLDQEGNFLRKEFLHACVTTLGKIGSPEDIQWLEPFLIHSSSLVREGTAISLGRIGEKSLPLLKQSFSFSDPDLKKQAVVAADFSADPEILQSLENGLSAEDLDVQKMSLSAVEQISSILQENKKKLRSKAKGLKRQGSENELKAQKIFLYGE